MGIWHRGAGRGQGFGEQRKARPRATPYAQPVLNTHGTAAVHATTTSPRPLPPPANPASKSAVAAAVAAAAVTVTRYPQHIQRKPRLLDSRVTLSSSFCSLNSWSSNLLGEPSTLAAALAAASAAAALAATRVFCLFSVTARQGPSCQCLQALGRAQGSTLHAIKKSYPCPLSLSTHPVTHHKRRL